MPIASHTRTAPSPSGTRTDRSASSRASTCARAPTATAGDRLAIVLGVQGNARTRADGHGGLSLTGPDGKHLSYTGLTATDARGHVLATSLTASGSRAVIHVDTAGAVYPLRIDPFIQVAKFERTDPARPRPTRSVGRRCGGNDGRGGGDDTDRTTPPGAVDMFVANSGRWELGATRVAQLTDPDPGEASALGGAVRRREDVAVGAPSATSARSHGVGKVFVFEEPAGGWAGTITTPTATLDETRPLALADSARKVGVDLRRRVADRRGRPGPGFRQTNPELGAGLTCSTAARRDMDEPPPDVQPSATAGTGDRLGISSADRRASGDTIVAGATTQLNITGFGRASPTSSKSRNDFVASDEHPRFLGAQAGRRLLRAGDRDLGRRQDDRGTGRPAAAGRGAAYVFTSPNGTWPDRRQPPS